LDNAAEGKIKQDEKIQVRVNSNFLRLGMELRTITDLKFPFKEQGPGLIIYQDLDGRRGVSIGG
jgi:hypothetical protein